MREVVIWVHCDACREEINEGEEGANSVSIIVRGGNFEIDLCDRCLGGGFFQEARPVAAKKAKAKGEYACPDCGRKFGTVRGLSRHQVITHTEGSA